MKRTSKDAIQKIMDRKRINDKVDMTLHIGKQHQQPEFDVILLDKVFRPFCHAMYDEREKEQPDAEEAKQAVSSLLANMAVEFIVNIAERSDPGEASKQAQIIINQIAEFMSAGLQANYEGGLHTTPPDGKLDS